MHLVGSTALLREIEMSSSRKDDDDDDDVFVIEQCCQDKVVKTKITSCMILEHTGESSLYDVNCLVLRNMNVDDFESKQYVMIPSQSR